MSQLAQEADILVKGGLRPTTRTTYSSAENQYLKFCHFYSFIPVPTTEDILCLYVTFMFNHRHLKYGSIRVYLSAVRSLHVRNGIPYPSQCHKLALALRGVANNCPPPAQKLPITYDMLVRMHKLHSDTYNDLVYWTAICLGFYGCLRAAEFTVNQPFDVNIHLCMQDVTFHVQDNVPFIKVYLKQTKTSAGVSVIIGCSKTNVCAYCLLRKLLKARQTQHPHHPALFIFSNGQLLNKALLVKHVRFCLACLGIQPELYSGHSLRAGSATTAGTKYFQGWEVKMLGRWASQCFNIYIRSTTHIAQFSERLASKQNCNQ